MYWSQTSMVLMSQFGACSQVNMSESVTGNPHSNPVGGAHSDATLYANHHNG